MWGNYGTVKTYNTVCGCSFVSAGVRVSYVCNSGTASTYLLLFIVYNKVYFS